MLEGLISIIVPVYNAEKYLQKCIESIRVQSYSALQIIMVDDGSTDNSLSICEKYAAIDTRIKVLHQENQGVVSARSYGSKFAKGEYIGFVDADDWVEPNMYELLYNAAHTYNAELVIGGTFLDRGDKSSIDPNRSLQPGVYDKESGILIHNIIYSDDYTMRGISSSLWNKIFKRELILPRLNSIDRATAFSEDELCVYDCIINADRVCVIENPVYHYCRRKDSVTMNSDPDYFFHVNLFYKQLKNVFMQSEDSKLLMEKLNHYIIEMYLKGVNFYSGKCGKVIPIIMPDLKELIDQKCNKVILYGASDTGQDYYRFLQLYSSIQVVAWTEYRWMELKEQGLPLIDVKCLKDMEYDKVLIAVESRDLATKIAEELSSEYNISNDKFYWKSPIRLVETF